MRGLVLLALMRLASMARADAPLLLGIDHIPIVVGDLQKAQSDFRAMGFAIKPGRFHADGIRNAHVKFPDGTELELINAPAATDALASEYYTRQQRGDGPVYWGLWAGDPAALAARLTALGFAIRKEDGLLSFAPGDALHPLFFGSGEVSPTDRPEYFTHANTALRLSGLWVRGNTQERALFAGLAAPVHRVRACGPLGAGEDVVLPRGDVMLITSAPRDGGVAAARIEVKNLDVAEAVMRKNGLKPRRYPACASLWLPPSVAHGIWLEFVQA